MPSSKLVIPLDTHMHRISLKLNLTKRNKADMRTALEVRALKGSCLMILQSMILH